VIFDLVEPGAVLTGEQLSICAHVGADLVFAQTPVYKALHMIEHLRALSFAIIRDSDRDHVYDLIHRHIRGAAISKYNLNKRDASVTFILRDFFGIDFDSRPL
jgi:hypothetical protein